MVFGGVSLCFLMSGFAALLYQTAWIRQLSIVFGTSDLAVATILDAYKFGDLDAQIDVLLEQLRSLNPSRGQP